MDMSRALAVTAAGIDVHSTRLRAIARTEVPKLFRSPKSQLPAKTVAIALLSPAERLLVDGDLRQANLRAMQSARSLLVRAIALLK